MQNIYPEPIGIPGTLVRFSAGSVALTGLPGTGKTTLGYLLCQETGVLVSDGRLHVTMTDGLMAHPPFNPHFHFGFPPMLPGLIHGEPESIVDQESGKLITLVNPDCSDTGLPAKITDLFWLERTGLKQPTILRASVTELSSLLRQNRYPIPDQGLEGCRLFRLRIPGDPGAFRKAAKQIGSEMKALHLIQPTSI
ncbi:MAG: hypothetical protein HUU10_06180 [Bacteroidetes bacterium]|nr:hypothetical protein [Bacteroidota bacterium]